MASLIFYWILTIELFACQFLQVNQPLIVVAHDSRMECLNCRSKILTNILDVEGLNLKFQVNDFNELQSLKSIRLLNLKLHDLQEIFDIT